MLVTKRAAALPRLLVTRHIRSPHIPGPLDSFHLAQTGHVVLEAGREVHDDMTKAQAASMIEELQQSTGRGRELSP